MEKMMAWFICPDCGLQYVYNSDQLRIYHTADNHNYLINAMCSCGQITEDYIDPIDLVVLSHKGVKVASLNSKYSELSEIDINSWDIDKELAENGL